MKLLDEFLRQLPVVDEIKFLLNLFDSKVIGEILGAFLLSLVVFVSMRLRKRQAIREDGWFYLAPGFLSKFALIGSALISLGTIIGFIVAFRRGYRPTLDAQEIISLIPAVLLIVGFGTAAAASYIGYFRNKVRWNHTYIEKIAGRHTTRIAWKDVQEIRQKKGSDFLWIVSKSTRIRVWTHMNGVEQLISAVDGNEEAFGLLRQSKPFMESKPRPDYAGSFNPHAR